MGSDRIEGWRIKDFDLAEGAVLDAALGAGDGWIIAQAPGDTYLALHAAGRIAHPYEGRNEAAVAWVRDREWWWHATLELAPSEIGERLALEFDGLDTFADVYLDGEKLGSADNMFRTWRFDLTGIAPGRHDLAVCFHPPGPITGQEPLPIWDSFTDRVSRSRRTAIRKAQFGWGWDWGPDLPTVGIWLPVKIKRSTGPLVESVNFTTLTLTDAVAEVRIDVALSAPARTAIELLAPDGSLAACGSLDDSGALILQVPDPQPWWTPELGGQPLYSLIARIDGQADYVRRVGLRTVAIDQSADPHEPGTTFFRFIINGVPIFAKGSNWVPADSFVGAIADATYRDLLERAVAANMNMIRVWGGGIYEPDIFYNLCDELGLLVWQDFMFACAPYPEDDPAFIANVAAEVEQQVLRLRHHACLALWCGNNENQAIHWFNDVLKGSQTSHEGLKYYDEVIPDVLAELDPETAYWPSSPWGGPTPNSMRGGDVHNWTVWHGVPPIVDAQPEGGYATTPEGSAFIRYEEDMARFVSEFGLQSAADVGTLRRWMAPDDCVLGCDGLLERVKDVADKASMMMAPVTGLPADLEQFVAFSQLSQAEGLKFGIEHYRSRKPHCSGALIWQHNDCWPCVSWSLIDYDGVAKAAFFAVARAFAPVMANFRLKGDEAELWVVNDTLAPMRGIAIVAMRRLEGGEDWREMVPLDLEPNAARVVWRGIANPGINRVLTVRSADNAFPANRRLLGANKDLALSDPGLTVSWSGSGNRLEATIMATRYAVGVALLSSDPGLRFEDNHFDLAGGETQTIAVWRSDGDPVDRSTIRLESWNEWLRN